MCRANMWAINRMMDASDSACNTRPHVLVTGAIRTGSTYVGHVLSRAKGLSYIDEPFNRERGIVGVNHWFPYASSPHDYYGRMVEEFMRLNVRYRFTPTGSRLKMAAKRVIGGRAQWRLRHFRWLGRRSGGMLIKDPLAIFLSDYMHRRFGVGVLVLVRHPAAFYYSVRRLGWRFDPSELLRQDRLVEELLMAERPLLERTHGSPAEQYAILWRCIYRVVLQFSDEHCCSGGWLVRRHEDISVEPEREFQRIFEALNIPFSESVRQFVRKSTSRANPAVAPGNRTHVIRRDSAALVDYWRQRVPNDEQRVIRKVVGEVGERFYPEW